MSDVSSRLKTIKYKTKQDSSKDCERLRSDDDASFREVFDYFPDEKSNSATDISTAIFHRSLSADFQDSFDFFNIIEDMSHPGGTNSLPAFLTGRSGGHPHSTLLQQSLSNRAVENDYCDNPPPQRIPPSRSRGHSHSRSTRNASGTNDHSHRRHRHRQHLNDPSGTRHNQTRSTNRRHCNREEGPHISSHGTVSTSAIGALTQRDDRDFDTPPPRPPLSKYHIEHRYASRALRPSSSLPASLPIRTGNDLLVPMRHNPMPYQPRYGRRDRHRTGGSSSRSHSDTLRGYSLTPPPVCRANKPKYDANNRIIQTVSSPSVVTQCVDSSTVNSWRSQNQWSFLPSPGNAGPTAKHCSSREKQPESVFDQPTHVVISQQPKHKIKKKLLEDDDDDITRQKQSLVVNMNNNFATQPVSGEKTKTKKKKKKQKNAKSCDVKDSEKGALDKPVPTDSTTNNGQGDQHSSTEITPLKSGERCPRCGKCSEDDPEQKTAEDPPDSRCDFDVDTCIETATCFCCVKGLFYHCLSHEDEETFAEKPCSCKSEKCCLRWSIMGILSLCLPCLFCYPLARGGVKLCRSGCGCLKSGCQCNEPYS